MNCVFVVDGAMLDNLIWLAVVLVIVLLCIISHWVEKIQDKIAKRKESKMKTKGNNADSDTGGNGRYD